MSHLDEKKQNRSLRKMPKNYKGNWLAGVCGGIGYYLDLPVWLIRIFTVLLAIEFPFCVMLIYAILAGSLKSFKSLPEDLKE